MTLKSLREDFQQMGLSENRVNESMRNLLGEDFEQEINKDDDTLDDDELEDDDPLAIIERRKRLKRKTGKEKIAGKKQRRSASGKRSAKKAAMARKRPGAKRAAAKRRVKLAKMGKAKKGYRRMVSSKEFEGNSLHASLMENIQSLVEAVEIDPVERFDEYLEAFNHVADLGELLCLKYHGMDEDELANEALDVTLAAEAIIEGMEGLEGVVDAEDDATLEEALERAMDVVEDEMEGYNEIMEGLDEEDDDDDLGEDIDDDDFEDDDDDDDDLEEAKKKKKKGLSGFEKNLKKGRSDIRDPKKLAGWLAQNYPTNWDKKTRAAHKKRKAQ